MQKTFKIDYRVFAMGSVYSGQKTVIAKNKDEAIEILKKNQPNVINITKIQRD